MSRSKKAPRPIYRKPQPVPVEQITSDDRRAWAERHNAWVRKGPADQLTEHLGQLRDQLRAALVAAGVEFKSAGGAWPRHGPPGWCYSQTGDDVARYQTREMPPEIPQGIEALLALHELQRAEGAARVLAAYRLGRLVERYNTEALLAKPADDVWKREEARKAGHIPPEVIAATKAWWADHRAEYRSDNAARIACAAAIGGKPSRVRTIIEKH